MIDQSKVMRSPVRRLKPTPIVEAGSVDGYGATFNAGLAYVEGRFHLFARRRSGGLPAESRLGRVLAAADPDDVFDNAVAWASVLSPGRCAAGIGGNVLASHRLPHNVVGVLLVEEVDVSDAPRSRATRGPFFGRVLGGSRGVEPRLPCGR
jgi:hypothetical protein